MAILAKELRYLNWRKPLRSVSNGACVEVASGHKSVVVRDSKSTSESTLIYSPNAWRNFIDTQKLRN